ncbi:MAG: hypothetical protein PHX34_00115 [Candidatus Shapirobacteria bacterium]|nr:hypothetical protein [Candidatus Shapirobacteria bacterium]
MNKPLIVFTYAPAGLGHIRVADALMDSLPSDIDFITFSPSYEAIQWIHRFSSLNIFARHLMEWIQRGVPQIIFTRYYRKYLKTHTGDLFLEFTSLIKSQKNIPKNIIIASTHFGLTYQLGSIKEKLEKELNTKIYLVAQITDDSPQYIWYTDTADLIIAPSLKTAQILQKYGAKEGLKEIPFEVLPYPIIPSFIKTLSPEKLMSRQNQYNPKNIEPINIIIPISGAAVGMNFFTRIIEKLHKLSNRFVFYVVCRKAPFTQDFIKNIENKSYINIYVSESYQEVVHMYNRIYQNNVISSEITKPSEQSFKALLNPDSVGGSFLFFANPVGRQEYDNLIFLKKNHLLSPDSRGVILPKGSTNSAKFIYKYYQKGILLDAFKKFKADETNLETKCTGAILFWKAVLNYFN